jgi:hypothetical protein
VPLEFRRTEVHLIGNCGAEDALELAEWLSKRKRPKVHMSECAHLHAALLQTLEAFRPVIVTPPADPFLARWVMPAFAPPRALEKEVGT